MIEVYCHTSPSGKQYVGYSTRGAAARWKQHVSVAERGSAYPLHCAIRKYGADSFRHELLALCDTEAGAQRAERAWIASRGTLVPAGYNATEGGEGMRPSAEVRAKMSAALLGNTRGSGRKGCKQGPWTPQQRANALAANRGRVLSAEHRRKIGGANRGRTHTAESRARISAAKKGQGLGRKHSPETLEKMRVAWVARRSRTETDQ